MYYLLHDGDEENEVDEVDGLLPFILCMLLAAYSILRSCTVGPCIVVAFNSLVYGVFRIVYIALVLL